MAAQLPTAAAPAQVTLSRVPEGGIQPQVATDSRGTVHLIYLKGDPATGDIYYTRKSHGETSFANSQRVNNVPGSAIALGTIRGAHLALGKNGHPHVAWMGSGQATPKAQRGAPMLYTRLNDDGSAFEPQRNLISWAAGLDGGGSLAADDEGNVYVAWHAGDHVEGEAGRKVYVARSNDDGRTFAKEVPAGEFPNGVCGCCGMRAGVDANGQLFLVFRDAGSTSRDMTVRASSDAGKTFRAITLNSWPIQQCPMSSAAILPSPKGTIAATERDGRIYLQSLKPGTSDAGKPVDVLGRRAKHPAMASNKDGEVLVVWTVGTGWNKGGALNWQLLDASGNRVLTESGTRDGVPKWSFAAVYAKPDGSFEILY